ncbi:MAG TPA: helix-turn-helix transcriptional regulator, partial [Thermoanaerobaculia bacterium]
MPEPENEEDEAKAARLLVIFLRSYADLKQTELGEITGLGQGAISRYETGDTVPSPESLRRISEAVVIPWPLGRELRRCFSAAIRSARRHWEDLEGDAGMLDALLERVLIATFPYLVQELAAELASPSPEEQRREAEEIWTNLQAYPMSRRRRLLELGQGAYPDWAVAERICEASLQAAEGEPDQALELADLALFVAGTIQDKGRRSRVEGYCWAHLAHARRAAHDLAGAEEAAARAWKLWQTGEAADPGLLSEGRLSDLAGAAPGT